MMGFEFTLALGPPSHAPMQLVILPQAAEQRGGEGHLQREQNVGSVEV